MSGGEGRTYLGDGVYAAVERGMIKLTTEDGLSVSNTVYLEQSVYNNLREYAERLKCDPFVGFQVQPS